MASWETLACPHVSNHWIDQTNSVGSSEHGKEKVSYNGIVVLSTTLAHESDNVLADEM